MWDAQVAKESTAVLICRKQAESALSAIDASGTHWVAPVRLTVKQLLVIDKWFPDAVDDSGTVKGFWTEIRDAFLSRQEGT